MIVLEFEYESSFCCSFVYSSVHDGDVRVFVCGDVRVFVCVHVLLGTPLTWHKSTTTDAKGGAVLGVAKARGFRMQKQRRMLAYGMLTYADVC